MRISDWNSDVCSSDLDGDLVSYAVMRDGRGRSNAAEVRFAGQRIAQRKPTRAPTRIPRRLLGSAALVTVVVGTAIGILPIVVAIASAGLSLLSYLMYWLDKEAAQGGARRIPESTLNRSEEHASELQALMSISYA